MANDFRQIFFYRDDEAVFFRDWLTKQPKKVQIKCLAYVAQLEAHKVTDFGVPPRTTSGTGSTSCGPLIKVSTTASCISSAEGRSWLCLTV